MKVELLVSLKVGDGRIIAAGTVFSDKNTPIPEFVIRRLNRGMARIIEHDPLPPPIPSISKPEVEKKIEKVVEAPKAPDKVIEAPKAAKKILKKSASAK
jgi:hypothetical protein